ncbi:MAG: redoxin domain-containing protein, partial [Planctomycetes bacterium]|nr:redoxin domain-containing protein [Planctomycetota bacterium]
MPGLRSSRPNSLGLFSSAICLTTFLFLAACVPSAPGDLSLMDLDGRPQKPLDLSGVKVDVVIFITNDCPIANSYAPEIKSIIGEYSSRGAGFFLVHVDPDLGLEKAKKHAADFGYENAILRDPRHVLGSELEADVTPEAFVIGKSGILYRGRIDDLYADLGKKRRQARTRDLRDALDAVLSGEAVENPTTRAVGCYIP